VEIAPPALPHPQPLAVARQHLIVGDAQNAVFELREPQLQIDKLTIGAHPGVHGEVHVGGGTISVGEGGVTVGAEGSGALYLGTPTLPGHIHPMPGISAPFIVRATPGAQGFVQGWGAINTGGTLINNGRIIADGFHRLRALDLSGFRAVTNTIDNTPDGDNGWFVRRGGKLRLPTLRIEPGTRTYTWGERDDAPLDLVNSLRLIVHDQPTPANLSISLRTIALADPLDLTLPTEISIIGLWQFDSTDDFDPARLDVLVRYNDRAANTFWPGESAVQMLAYRDGDWRIASNLSRDTLNNWIAGEFPGSIHYLVVGVPWDSDPLIPSALSRITITPPTSTVPEPSTMLLAAAGIASLLLRRRRHHKR
jgi:hypothetical protein